LDSEIDVSAIDVSEWVTVAIVEEDAKRWSEGIVIQRMAMCDYVLSTYVCCVLVVVTVGSKS
jgi:hypothetical protein